MILQTHQQQNIDLYIIAPPKTIRYVQSEATKRKEY